MNNLSQKNITLAKHAGFCYGVKRAVETTKKLKIENKNRNICVFGELIHNAHVIKELNNLGINTLDTLPECDCSGGICVIRSHGASYDVVKKLENKGFEIIDLTCPDVKKVQSKAILLAQEGYLLLIVGKPEHPEVDAIYNNASQFSNNILIVPNIETAKEFEDKIKTSSKVGVVVQTTQRLENLQEIINYLIPLTKELKVFNTICASTSLRQNEARDLALKSDLMVVVGSKKSANTSHLAEILTNLTKTIHIETDDELENYAELINNSKNIGVTAGASTPQDIIQNVIKKLTIY